MKTTELEECPICNHTLLSKPSIVFQIASCKHRFCSSCVDNTFEGRNICPCPLCRRILRRSDFKTEDFDANVAIELSYRKSLSKTFCFHLHDFDSESEYLEYLDLLEELVYNLSNQIDLEKTKSRIEEFRNSRRVSLAEAKSKQSEQRTLIEEKNSEFIHLILHGKPVHITAPQAPQRLSSTAVGPPGQAPAVKRVSIEAERKTKLGDEAPLLFQNLLGDLVILPLETKARFTKVLLSPWAVMPSEAYDPTKDVVQIGPASFESSWDVELKKRLAGGWCEGTIAARNACSTMDLDVFVS
ncbi:hypothetical protein GEMRC1_005033 [Eukaryota sp. GEM-RC1]